MRAHVFLALSGPSEGREEEFHRWYDACHLQDVVDLCPGFVAGHRYFAAEARSVPKEWPSLAVYLLESDNLALLHSQVALRTGQFTPSNGVFAPNHAAWVYSASADDCPALQRWAERAEAGVLVTAFYETAAEAKLALGLGDTDTSPLLTRGDGQRAGEIPTWPYLVLVRASGPIDPVALGGAAAVWTFEPHGTCVHSKPR